MKRRRLFAVGALACLSRIGAAIETRPTGRFALVIGNGSYNGHVLPNTRPDAELVATALGKAGFTVSLRRDLDRSSMFEAVRRFATDLPAGATALVYYAGHGLQIKGSNYLLPVDITPTSEAGVALRAFPLQALNERLALARSAVNIIILDACRNNPFQPVPAVRLRNYANLGLASARAPKGTLVAYSTAPGQMAEDGSGRKHSIYTETLAGLLGQRGLRAEDLFHALSDEVRRRTLEDQQPWFESSLSGEFYFLPPPGWHPPAPGANAPAARSARVEQRYRGGSIGGGGADSWYLDMDERAWTELDIDMERRTRGIDAEAFAQLEAKAARGNVVAMTMLGLAGRRGADKWLRKAANLAFPVAQTELAERMIKGHSDGASAQAIGLLERAARARYPRARIDLAQMQMQRAQSPESVQQLFDTILKNTNATMQQYRGAPRTNDQWTR